MLLVILQEGRKLSDRNAAVKKNLSINDVCRKPTVSLNSKFAFCLWWFMHTVKHSSKCEICVIATEVLLYMKTISLLKIRLQKVYVCKWVCVFCYVRHLGLNRIPHWNGIDQKKVRQGYWTAFKGVLISSTVTARPFIFHGRLGPSSIAAGRTRAFLRCSRLRVF